MGDHLVEERGLQMLTIKVSGSSQVASGLASMVLNPLLTLRTLSWIFLNDFSRSHHLIKFLVLLPACFGIWREIRKEQPDVVHLFWGHYPAVVGYLIARTLPEIRLSMFLGAYDLEYNLGISRSVSRYCSHVFTHSSANIPAILRMGIPRKKLEVIHRGVDVQQLAGLLDNKDCKKSGWVTAGRLLESKGFDHVIRLLAEARKKDPKLNLTIAGDGPQLAYLQSLANHLELAEHCTFTGHISQNRLIKLMSQAEFFFLLSSKPGERLPNVLKEAMYCGCICVTLKTPGIEELIKHGETGFLVEDRGIPACLELVSTLGKEGKNRMRSRAQQLIAANFDVLVSMRRYLQVWRNKVVSE